MIGATERVARAGGTPLDRGSDRPTWEKLLEG